MGGLRRAGFEPAFLSVRGIFIKIRSVIASSFRIALYIEIPWSVSPINFAPRVGLETLLKKGVHVFFALQYLFVSIDPFIKGHCGPIPIIWLGWGTN
jgi:hypothetical protein